MKVCGFLIMLVSPCNEMYYGGDEKFAEVMVLVG